ncbi:MAG: hypothetical protein KJ949_01420 [Nanoarchaeota archaeon]|nr:hypothetical protein [Nanoarchaeota archaeon]
MERININKSAIIDLLRLKEQFNSVVESIELMSDERFMESHKRSKEQIANREFANWNDL